MPKTFSLFSLMSWGLMEWSWWLTHPVHTLPKLLGQKRGIFYVLFLHDGAPSHPTLLIIKKELVYRKTIDSQQKSAECMHESIDIINMTMYSVGAEVRNCLLCQ